ncbi:MAG: hypothetical protein HKN92_03985 [Chitinophagales bacterium]|nr:hypothetical protein [Chitinophagales bacterium]
MSYLHSFLPHRPPFLMVDSITGYSSDQKPTLTAEKYIKADEAVFAHSEGPFVWPAVYLIEGAAQCAGILSYLQIALKNNEDPEKMLATIIASYQNDTIKTRDTIYGNSEFNVFSGSSKTGMLSMLDVQIFHTVSSGSLVSYQVIKNSTFKGQSQFDIEVFSQEKLVLEGRIFATHSLT